MKYFVKILTYIKEGSSDEKEEEENDEISNFISYTQKDLLYNISSNKFFVLEDRDNWNPVLVLIISDEEIKPNDWMLEHNKLNKFEFNSHLQEIVDRINYWRKRGLYHRVAGKAPQNIIEKLINGEMKDGDEVSTTECHPITF